MTRSKTAALAALALSLTSASALAGEFRWSAQGDAQTMDPHGVAEGFTLAFLGNVYEGLVRRGADLALEPALATSWEQTDETVWRFELREGVRFQGGETFDADDVVFSFERATGESSGIANILSSIERVEAIDDHTVELHTKAPDPILPEAISNWLIMDRGWAEANDAVRVANPKDGEARITTSVANGTGPFVVTVREADQRTELEAFEGWWDERSHDVDVASFTPIGNDGTRVAALLSGELDMVMPVPVQNVARIEGADGFSVLQGPELRTIFLGMDVASDTLIGSSADGNPLRDVRVRMAFAHAIDGDAIVEKVMRGAASRAGMLIGPGINGFDPAMNEPYQHDPERARELLEEAGWGDGFDLAMHCPNDRYVNDEAICQAVVSMLAKVGVEARLEAMPKSIYFGRLQNLESGFYLLGWTSGTYDAHHPMRFLLHSRGTPEQLGTWNFSRYSNPEVDRLIAEIGVETDPEERRSKIDETHAIVKEEIPYIPLHQQALAWGVRDGVSVEQRADGFFNLRFVRLDEE